MPGLLRDIDVGEILPAKGVENVIDHALAHGIDTTEWAIGATGTSTLRIACALP